MFYLGEGRDASLAVIFVAAVAVRVPFFPSAGAKEKSSLCTGSPCCEPGARVEAAFVFSVSWCLQQILTTVEVYSVVSVFLNYLILCSVYMKIYLCIFHQVSI